MLAHFSLFLLICSVVVVFGKPRQRQRQQMWYYSKANEIRRDDACLDYAGGFKNALKPNQINTFPCHGDKGNQEWTIGDVRLRLRRLSLMRLRWAHWFLFCFLFGALEERTDCAQDNRLVHRVHRQEGGRDGSMRLEEVRTEVELEGEHETDGMKNETSPARSFFFFYLASCNVTKSRSFVISTHHIIGPEPRCSPPNLTPNQLVGVHFDPHRCNTNASWRPVRRRFLSVHFDLSQLENMRHRPLLCHYLYLCEFRHVQHLSDKKETASSHSFTF